MDLTHNHAAVGTTSSNTTRCDPLQTTQEILSSLKVEAVLGKGA